MTAGTIAKHSSDGVGWIVIDNPLRRNALSADMMRSIAAAVNAFDASGDVRMIAIRGAGDRAFASGADIGALESRSSSEDAQIDYDTAVDAMFSALSAATTPIVAMVQGFCFGAGVAIALAADVRFGDDRSVFAIPAARMGIGYPLALTRRLVSVVGPAHASEILFSAGRIDAHAAMRIGLLNRITEPSDLEALVVEFGRTISENAPLTIKAAKLSIAAALDEVDETVAQQAIDACMRSKDAIEGPTAFREKRTPRFEGH